MLWLGGSITSEVKADTETRGKGSGKARGHHALCSPGSAPLRPMQPQGAFFVSLPHLGPILFWLFTRYSVTDWCKGLRTLSWCPPYKTVLLVWTTIYSLMG